MPKNNKEYKIRFKIIRHKWNMKQNCLEAYQILTKFIKRTTHYKLYFIFYVNIKYESRKNQKFTVATFVSMQIEIISYESI